MKRACLLLGACALAGCSCDPFICDERCMKIVCEGTEGCDAGVDGGRDAGADGGRDAGAGLDAGMDARVDGGPLDPGWTTLPGLPAGCVVERAEHPERLPMPAWASCGEGCWRAPLDLEWNLASDEGFLDAGRGWLALYVGTLGDSARMPVIALAEIGRPAIAGWRFTELTPESTSGCWVSNVTVADGRFAAEVLHVGDLDLNVVEERVYTGSLEVTGTPETPAAILSAPLVGMRRTIRRIAPATDLVGIQIVGGVIAIAQGGAVEVVNGGSPATAAFHLSAEGDHAVFATADANWRLLHWTPETGTESYFDPPEEIGDPLLHDGELVWIRYAELDDAGVAARAELWAAPFVRDPAALTPRLVHPSVVPIDPRFSDGTYGWMTDVSRAFEAHLVDTATGRERVLPLPPGATGCNHMVYVSRSEVLLGCFEDGVRGSVLYRVDPRVYARDALP